jgi:predicted lipid-binding transport protein (Tim44 family)
MNGWGVLVALLCVLLAARYSRWRRLAASPAQQSGAAAAAAGTAKKQLWIRRDPPAAAPSAPAAAMADGGGAGGGEGETVGDAMPTPEQLQDLACGPRGGGTVILHCHWLSLTATP